MYLLQKYTCIFLVCNRSLMNTYICVALQKNMLFIIKGKDNIMFSHLPL